MNHLMIYGAAGYTGRMAAAHATATGLPVILAGRSEAPLLALAAELRRAHRVFMLDDPTMIDAALEGVGILLNCAGPFVSTAEPLMRAALRTGVHYLDIAAELDSYRLAEVLDAEAQAAGVGLPPEKWSSLR